MEVVRSFNNELSSLYEVRPPISKAKMTQITKCAIKGIKFYKHIVQSVEKFIQKCRPEYKVPGLYVVDSIVRQSRHQFGADKDVFAPRFTKNIMLTFQNLFKCAEEDRPKIVRVLNLWQKNTVFPSDVIQPLLDMANPNNTTGSLEAPTRIAASESPAHKSLQHSLSSENVLSQNSKHKSHDLSAWKGWSHSSQLNDEPMPDCHSFSEISVGNAEKVAKGESSLQSRDDMLPHHLSHVNSQSHVNKVIDVKPPDDSTVKFNKKLLDFDYGDEEDEEEAKREDGQLSNEPNALALSMAQNLLSNPELLRQLQQMQQTIQQNEALKSELALKSEDAPVMEESECRFSPIHESPPAVKAAPPPEKHQDASFPLYNSSSITFPPQQPPLPGLEKHLCDAPSHQQPALPQEPCLLSESHVDEDERIMFSMPGEPPLPPRDLDERSLLGATSDDRPPNASLPFSDHQPNLMQFQFDNSAIPFPSQPPLPLMDPVPMDTGFPVNILPPEPMVLPTSQVDEDDRIMYSMPGEPPLPPHDLDERSLVIPGEERVKKERSRSRSGSRSRVRSSRQRSRSKSPRRKKSRSRSGSRSRSRRNRSRSREKLREKEKEREREREREREHERKRKGIPPKKKNCMSVCSTTLWLGHVPKTISETELTSTFGDYGTISSIDMIPPRGCAYICMDRRQDAYRCLTKLKNLKLQNCSIKMAWAPGKGVKGKDYKDYWEVSLGVSYIPFDKLPDNLDDLDLLEEGGFIDEESMPDDLREMRQKRDKKKAEHMDVGKTTEGNDISVMKDTVLPQPPSMMPPSSMSMPMMMPQLMQPQFGVHIPGLLPPHSMVMPVPMGVPPPNPLMMVQPPSQQVLGGQPLPVVGTVPQMPHLSMSLPTAPVVSTPVTGVSVASTETSAASPTVTTSMSLSNAGDATPTEEEGTSVSTPGPTSIAPTAPSVLPPASLQSSVSIPSTGIQPPSTVTQFNPVLGLHNGGRPVISVPPPVSATGAPIPFPPPNVNFGFPPPPIRPPGQLPNSPSFPWLQKPVAPGAPGFLNYPEADGRFASPLPTGTPNVRPVPPPPPVAPQSGLQPYGVRLPHFPEMPPSDQTITSTTHAGMGEMTNNRKDGETEITSSDFRTGDESGHGNHNSMKGFQHDHMKVRGHLDDSMGEQDDSTQELFHGQNMDYPHDDYSGLPPNPRFPGDFHHPRGPMNMPWMHGPPPPGGLPSPRFPRGLHPGTPFPHRMGGPRGMHPRMEMDFHRHQGPRGPRMPMGSPHGPQNRRGGGTVGVSGANSTLLQTPRHPGGRERFPGRRGEFYDSPYERDHDRRYRDRDDWGRGRDRREPRDEKEDWNAQAEDWDRQSSDKERERKKSDSQPGEIPESQQNNRENRVTEKDNAPAPKRPRLPPNKVQTSKDLTDDFFRLQFYSRDKDKKPQLPKDIRSSGIKESNQDILISKDFPSKQHGDIEAEQSKEQQSDKPVSDIKSSELEEPRTKQEDKLNQSDIVNREESHSKSQLDNVGKSSERGTRERKRSRWGRTISEEREFQQQRINEIEMKFNNYALLQSTQTESNVNGNVTVGEGTENGNNMSIPNVISSAVDVPEVTSTTGSNSYSAEIKENVNIAADTKELENMVECSEGMGAVFDPVPEPNLTVEANCVLENADASDVPEIPHETSVTYHFEKESPSQIPETNDSEVAPTEEES